MSDTLLIQNARAILPEEVALRDVWIEDGKIKEVAQSLSVQGDVRILDAQEKYLLPGFVDIHNHGAMGFDASLGSYQQGQFLSDPLSYQQGLSAFCEHNLKHGSTRILATSLAMDLDKLIACFAQIGSFTSNLDKSLSAVLAGINLEGTFLKMPAYAGAQNPDYFYPATREIFDALQEASGGNIRVVNIPPEHGHAGIELIQYVKRRGGKVAGGHSGAHFEEFTAGIDAGLDLAVHFFNGPSYSSSKSFYGGGAVEAMLQDERVSLEFIVDGYHVHPVYFRDAHARKGTENCILITDSMFMNGLTGLKEFELAGMQGSVSDNGAYLQVIGKDDTLFGSVLSMDTAFSNVLTWLTQEMKGFWSRFHEAMDWEEALLQTSQMASKNPAQYLNLYETSAQHPGTGSIEVGKWADLILGDIQEGPQTYQLNIDQVLLQGKIHER